ncbi:recombinase family protein [Janibacter sp. RAF52]|uniref:recombinase family protein n=1 Tax=unclassified Janibacter TaxID=2649294 RepID=UPI003F905241
MNAAAIDPTQTPSMKEATMFTDEMPKRTAVSYIRVSTTDQATRGGLAEGLSIPAQRQAIAAKAQSIDALVIHEFVEAGESGKTSNRPALQQMLEFLTTNRVDMVIVHKIDRLARNRADDVKINLAIRETGAQLVSVVENVDETPQGQLIHGIFSSFAEFYSRNLATEVLKGMEQKVQNGGTLSRAPMGYLNIRTMVNGAESRTVEIDPDRADHVRWAFETYASNPDMTCSRLAELLQDRGLTTRATAKIPAKAPNRNTVYAMLTNRYYIGYVTFRGVEYPGMHEPLVDEATFTAVQERFAANRTGSNRERKHLHYLAGSLRCHRCKSRMQYSVNTGRHGGKYEYYMCSGRHTKANDCDLPYIAVHRIEDAVEGLWSGEHGKWTVAALPDLRSSLAGHLRALQDESNRSMSTVKRQIGKIKDERYKWAEMAMQGSVPSDIAREKQEQLARRLAAMEAELAAMTAAGVDTEQSLDRVLELLTTPGRTYCDLDYGLRRTYNQAWFTWIDVDAESEDPDDAILVSGEPTPIAEALDASRELVMAKNATSDADPGRPTSLGDTFTKYVQGSIRNPLVDVKGLEPLTFRV